MQKWYTDRYDCQALNSQVEWLSGRKRTGRTPVPLKCVLVGAEVERADGCFAPVSLPILLVFHVLITYPELFSTCHPYITGKSLPL